MTSGDDTLTRRRLVALGGAAAAGLLAGRSPLAAAAPAPTGGRFVTEPDWSPPPVVVATPADGTAPGWIFVAPISFSSATIPPGTFGPLILDNAGEPVWFLPLATIVAQNFCVQKYRGNHVLTWYEGAAGGTYGGSCVIYDSTYHELKRVHAGNGYDCDVHEFLITSRNTALLSVYNEVIADLSSVGGPAAGRLVEGVVQEIDIATGRVLFEWHSAEHVAVDESYRTALTTAGNVDYFHLNAIGVDPLDDNLVVSARHTSTVYKLDRKTGAIIWRLGGKKNDFELGPGAAFNFQHDARAHADGTLTMFDNGATGPGAQDVEPASRPLRLALDTHAMTAELEQVYQASEPRLGIALGDLQDLPDGGAFVGWGAAGPFTEFTPAGDVRFDANFGDGSVSYRAFRLPWVGRPTTSPAIAAAANGDGTMTVHVSWNGATEVARWQVRAGAAAGRLKAVHTAPRAGFETAITVPATSGYIAVAALDAKGEVLGTSPPLAV
jgi:Arylsulfotransferase (ASST)